MERLALLISAGQPEAEMKPQRLLATLLAASLLMVACGGGNGSPANSGNNGENNATPGTSSTTTGSTGSTRTAQISELRNSVDARQTTAIDWATAAEGDPINAGGGVRTGDESRVRIDTSDKSLIRIGANTEFQLLEFSPQTENPVTRLHLDAGQVWVQVTEALGTGSFEVETPAGVATVRGSLMSVAFDRAAGQLAVTCLEGECELRDQAQNTVQLVAGEASEIVGVGQGPGAVRRMRRVELQAWIDNFPEAAEIAGRLLALLGEETPTPTTPGGSVGQTACDHPYFPMRPGATWTYSSNVGAVIWTIESVTGDTTSASAVMAFTMAEIQGTYNWTCTASGGLTSYDFGNMSGAGLTVFNFEVSNTSGSFLPPAELLTVGYGWTNVYDTSMSFSGAGEGSSTSSTNESLTVIGAEPVSFGGETFEAIQVARSGSITTQGSFGGISVPSQTIPINSTMVFARGVGPTSFTDDTGNTQQLVSYNIP